MHEHVGKRAKMQRRKESQMGGQSKQGKHIHTWSGERVCIKQTDTMEVYLTSGRIQQATKGTNATTQASGPKDQQTQTHGGHKAWQSLNLDKQTWM